MQTTSGTSGSALIPKAPADPVFQPSELYVVESSLSEGALPSNTSASPSHSVPLDALDITETKYQSSQDSSPPQVEEAASTFYIVFINGGCAEQGMFTLKILASTNIP